MHPFLNRLRIRKLRRRHALYALLILVPVLACAPALLGDRPNVVGRKLMAQQLHLLHTGHIEAARKAMRPENPEWDFMGRTYLALALANAALAEPAQTDARLADLDRLIDATVEREQAAGSATFLLPYVHDQPFIDPGGRSLFIDGEVALMLAARQVVRREPRHDAELAGRLERVLQQMQAGPMLSAESYPDECWTFCNTTALAALRLHDVAYGTDHGAFLRRWVANARAHLLDPQTGLLVSSFHHAGKHLDGPEGSSLWMSAHNLLLVDPEFAREQYALARKHLRRSLAGFGWAREWPAVRLGVPDIDSGFLVPLADASSASSGLALVAAGAFDDQAFTGELVRSLQLAAGPVEQEGRLHFSASNQVGDAVMAYALVQGPLWARARPDRRP